MSTLLTIDFLHIFQCIHTSFHARFFYCDLTVIIVTSCGSFYTHTQSLTLYHTMIAGFFMCMTSCTICQLFSWFDQHYSPGAL